MAAAMALGAAARAAECSAVAAALAGGPCLALPTACAANPSATHITTTSTKLANATLQPIKTVDNHRGKCSAATASASSTVVVPSVSPLYCSIAMAEEQLGNVTAAHAGLNPVRLITTRRCHRAYAVISTTETEQR